MSEIKDREDVPLKKPANPLKLEDIMDKQGSSKVSTSKNSSGINQEGSQRDPLFFKKNQNKVGGISRENSGNKPTIAATIKT